MAATVVCLLLLLFISDCPLVLSFPLVKVVQRHHFSHPTIHDPVRIANRVGCLSAKPPPSSRFDLKAIEEFESELLELERVNKSREENGSQFESDDDDDNVLDGDIDDEGSSAIIDTRSFNVPLTMDKMRIDAAVSALLAKDETILIELSRSFCGSLVVDGRVTVNGAVELRKSVKVTAGQTLQIQLPLDDDKRGQEIEAQNIPLDVLYEDDHMIVLNKAAGMVVHPAAGNWDGTVVNALAYYLADVSSYDRGEFIPRLPHNETSNKINTKESLIGDNTDASSYGRSNSDIQDSGDSSFRPGIVHRLDKGTTGVLVVAKTRAALAALSEQFSARRVKKTYLAIAVGNPGRRVVIDKAIGRHPVFRQRMRVVPDPHQKDSSGTSPANRQHQQKSIESTDSGRRAVSLVDTIAFDGKLAFVQVRIETGRTHQIRVHLQDRHTPIYGDDVYGLADWNKRLNKTHAVSRPLLHAYRLQLHHPVSGESMTFQAPLADDMQRIVKTIYPNSDNVEIEVVDETEDDDADIR